MLRQLVFFFLIIVAGTGGELCVTRAMKSVGEVADFRLLALAGVIGRVVRVGWMWIGLMLMASGFLALLGMLSLENVIFVIPAMALSYAAGAFGGQLLLGERVSRQRWIGVALVCVGVALVFIGRG
jgi:drug/metabolite transporter (DMT)-like permease